MHAAFVVCTLFASVDAFTLVPTPGTPRYTWLREAEKKHGRVALLAAPSLAVIALATGQDPVPWLNAQPVATQLVFYSLAGGAEAFNLRRLDKGFKLKPGEVPGRLLPVTNATVANLEGLEDGAGRIAMLATAMTLAVSSM